MSVNQQGGAEYTVGYSRPLRLALPHQWLFAAAALYERPLTAGVAAVPVE
eukprot:NODE_26704_length_541_cov_3.318841.p3 GENE.NODE_26704_length_541_cov_3.318841~~NODE_26704_length_541_cov_3.318841.p3  ORF type:complete len:50 (+),score=12.71 NODE_26704_length_541_cov_3.318841:385-534(+)